MAKEPQPLRGGQKPARTPLERIGVAAFEIAVYAIGAAILSIIVMGLLGFVFWQNPLEHPMFDLILRGAAAVGAFWGFARVVALVAGGKI